MFCYASIVLYSPHSFPPTPFLASFNCRSPLVLASFEVKRKLLSLSELFLPKSQICYILTDLRSPHLFSSLCFLYYRVRSKRVLERLQLGKNTFPWGGLFSQDQRLHFSTPLQDQLRLARFYKICYFSIANYPQSVYSVYFRPRKRRES